MKQGDSFINKNPGSPERLWVVASDSTDLEPAVAAFMIEPIPKKECDLTRVVEPDEHPWVRRRSFVNYEGGRPLSREVQEALEAGEYCELQEMASPRLLRKIQEGAIESDFTPQKLQRMVAAALVA